MFIGEGLWTEFVGVSVRFDDDDGGSINGWVDGNTNGDGGDNCGSVFDGNTGHDDCGSPNGGSTVD